MVVPVRLSFRGMKPSASAEAQVQKRADELEQFHPRIVACKVMLEEATRRQHQGKIFHVRIDLTVPGREIVVNRDPAEHHAHEDLNVAIRDAFNAARRQLEDHVRLQGSAVKAHEEPLIGRIVTLFPEKGYGFLTTATGEEVYVHRNAVPHGGFEKLRLGDRVRYVLAVDPGEKGVQASTVVPLPTRA